VGDEEGDLAGAALAEVAGISEVMTSDLVDVVEDSETDTTRDQEVHHHREEEEVVEEEDSGLVNCCYYCYN